MPTEMKGQRIPVLDPNADPYGMVTQPGDYYGPVNYPSGLCTVWFLLPIGRDPGVPSEARAMHHVQSPPHVFLEEPDGTLTIRESLGCGPSTGNYWHGFLTEGRWELSKSKP